MMRVQRCTFACVRDDVDRPVLKHATSTSFNLAPFLQKKAFCAQVFKNAFGALVLNGGEEFDEFGKGEILGYFQEKDSLEKNLSVQVLYSEKKCSEFRTDEKVVVVLFGFYHLYIKNNTQRLQVS